MNTNYNKKRHFELLKKRSIGINSEESSSELLEYVSMLEGHLHWETRELYLELVEELLKKNISIAEFCLEFRDRGLLISDSISFLQSNLILLSPDEKSGQFLDLLEEIFDVCEYFDPEDELDEDEFRNGIEKSFVKIKNYLNQK